MKLPPQARLNELIAANTTQHNPAWQALGDACSDMQHQLGLNAGAI